MKNMRKLLFVLILIVTQSGFAQNTPLDSLDAIIRQNEIDKDNTAIVENSIKRSRLVSKTQGDSMAIVELSKRAAILVDLTDSLQGKYYNRMGLMNMRLYQQFRTPDYGERAFLNFQKAIPFLKNDNHRLLPHAQSHLGLAYLIREENLSAIPLLEAAAKNFQENNNTLPAIRALMNLSGAHSSLGNFEKTIETGRATIELLKKVNDPKMKAETFISFAGNLASMQQLKAAEENYLIAVDYAKQADNPYLMSYALSALGGLHVTKTEGVYNLEQGKKELDEAMKLQKKMGDVYSLAVSDNFLSKYYLNTGEFDQALSASDRYISFFEKIGEKITLADAFQQRGEIFSYNNQLDSAAYYTEKGLAYARETSQIELTDICLEKMINIEKARENFASAFAYKEEHSELKDSLFNSNLEQALAEERIKQNLDAEQEAREKAELQASLLSSRNKLFGAIAAGLAGILLIGGYLFSQLRKTRNQLTTQNQQLKDLNATKDKFFGIIAHDIRSPITALDGVSEQMNYYLEKDDKTKLNRLADRIDTTAKRLTSLLDNLLNWALLQTGMIPYNPKSVNIQVVAQENIDLFTPVAEAKNIKLKNKISTNSSVFSDESALQTIIRNLINNAIKFTPTSGEVSISTEEKDDKIFIKINDTGTGIAADKLEKLFSLEKQSSKGTAGEKGSGLGLMLCKELVELNKGTIRAISELGKGSSFIFSLPRK